MMRNLYRNLLMWGGPGGMPSCFLFSSSSNHLTFIIFIPVWHIVHRSFCQYICTDTSSNAISLNYVALTSNDAKQYQQKTCLQRLHIIWAQPSSFSIGTLHMGQHLMRSESKGMPGSMRSLRPSLARRLVFSSHENPECQGFLQLEQKSDEQVGQWTLWGRHRSTGPQTLHTVSHPARGHHVLLTSRSTSADTKTDNIRALKRRRNRIRNVSCN